MMEEKKCRLNQWWMGAGCQRPVDKDWRLLIWEKALSWSPHLSLLFFLRSHGFCLSWKNSFVDNGLINLKSRVYFFFFIQESEWTIPLFLKFYGYDWTSCIWGHILTNVFFIASNWSEFLLVMTDLLAKGLSGFTVQWTVVLLEKAIRG